MKDTLREMHEEAVAKAISVFNDSAVGSGSARLKYEKQLQSFFKKSFEVIKSEKHNTLEFRTLCLFS